MMSDKSRYQTNHGSPAKILIVPVLVGLLIGCSPELSTEGVQESAPTSNPSTPLVTEEVLPSSEAPSKPSLVGHTWEANDLYTCEPPFGLSLFDRDKGIVRRTFSFGEDGIVTIQTDKSPPDLDGSEPSTLGSYVLDGKKLLIRYRSDKVDEWTVSKLTTSSVILFGEHGCKLLRVS
jgi:hypothetical protein